MANTSDNNSDRGQYASLFDRVRGQLGLPNSIDRSRYRNLLEVFEASVSQYAQRPAFSCLGHSLTFADVDKYSSEFAAYLGHQCGLLPGDRLIVQLPNVLQYPVVIFGAIKAGVIVVNTNPLYTSREMEHQFRDSGAVAIVVLANMAHKVQEILPHTNLQHVIVTEMADLHPAPKRQVLNFAVKHVKKMVPSYRLPHAVMLRDALHSGRDFLSAGKTVPHHCAEPEDIAVLQYTGGTTGIARGAMLSHGNLIANLLQLLPHTEKIGVEKGCDVVVAPLPLYHIYAFLLHNLLAFSLGCHSVLIPNPRDIPSFVRALRGCPLQIFVGLNTLFVALMENAEFRKLDFSALRTTLSGGMALSDSVARDWQQLTGCAIQEGYGLTETSPVVTLNPARHTRVGTIGVPLPETCVKTINDDGNESAEGESGELCVRGPQVMKGYWQSPQASADVMRDDWLLTGDIAIILPDGYVKIVDRKKDMILVSGFNVYPNEIENVVHAHPDVIECAAVGVADEHSGEAVKLFVVRRRESLTVEALQSFCAESLAGYKCPKHIEFRPSLPKSNVGKILRRELRKEFHP